MASSLMCFLQTPHNTGQWDVVWGDNKTRSGQVRVGLTGHTQHVAVLDSVVRSVTARAVPDAEPRRHLANFLKGRQGPVRDGR